jgi:hypothetical protein
MACVRSEQAVKADEVTARSWNQRGQAGNEIKVPNRSSGVSGRPRMPRSCRALLATPVAALWLAGCAGSSAIVEPCCYVGAEVTLAHLEEVELVERDGTRIPLPEAFPGFAPEPGPVTTSLPFRKADIARVVYQSLRPVLPLYDANRDGHMEAQELTVLYIREAALGLGYDVDHLTVDGRRVQALQTSAADIGGLIRVVAANEHRMGPEQQAVFRDLRRLGRDLLTHPDGPDGPDLRIFRR